MKTCRNLSNSSGRILRAGWRAGWFGIAAIGLGAAFASCSREARVDCVPVALVDSAGERSERDRIEFQWAAIRLGLDSVLRTNSGVQSHRSAEAGLDSSIARYNDSMRKDGDGLVSKSGCLDWKATWDSGRLDRSALVTSFLRALVRDSSSVMEWTVSEAVPGELRLHAIYAAPGPDGGTVDSAVLRLDPAMVSVVAR